MLSNPSPFATSYSKPDLDLAVAINEMCEHSFVGMTVSQAPESTVISISCHSGSLTTLIGLLRIGVRICNPLGGINTIFKANSVVGMFRSDGTAFLHLVDLVGDQLHGEIINGW